MPTVGEIEKRTQARVVRRIRRRGVKVKQTTQPTRADLATNLVINTDRRTYHIELRSTEKTYMASVSWQYPQDQLIALRRHNAIAEAAAPIESGFDIGRLNFRYAIEGDTPPWRPLRAFDDGAKVFIGPEESMRIQRVLGSDIVMIFDECTPYPMDEAGAAASMRLSTAKASMRWALSRVSASTTRAANSNR